MNRLETAIKEYYKNPSYCKFCGSIIEVLLPSRPPSEAKRMKFCNHSHAASYNNKGIKRHGKCDRICPRCKGKKYITSKLCHKCNIDKIYRENMNRPIKEFLSKPHLHPRFRHNQVRIWAKKLMKYWGYEKKCFACGYNKHIEVCHKRPISEFSLATKMGVVNSKENLVYLCPNHHWELDNKLLKL